MASQTSSGSRCMPLPEEVWLVIIDHVQLRNGIRAAKELRKMARVSKIFAHAARAHPDNIYVAV